MSDVKQLEAVRRSLAIANRVTSEAIANAKKKTPKPKSSSTRKKSPAKRKASPSKSTAAKRKKSPSKCKAKASSSNAKAKK